MTKVLSWLRNRTLAVPFWTWHGKADTAQQLRSVAERVVRRMAHSLLASTLDAWAHYAEDKARMRATMTSVLLRLRNKSLTSALGSWGAYVRAQVAARVVQSRVRGNWARQNLVEEIARRVEETQAAMLAAEVRAAEPVLTDCVAAERPRHCLAARERL